MAHFNFENYIKLRTATKSTIEVLADIIDKRESLSVNIWTLSPLRKIWKKLIRVYRPLTASLPGLTQNFIICVIYSACPTGFW